MSRHGAFRLLTVWLTTAVALLATAWILPGFDLRDFRAALLAAVVVATFNTLVPPAVARLPMPFPLLTGFLVALVVDAAMLMTAAAVLGDDDMTLDSWWLALIAALIATAVAILIGIGLGIDDEEAYALRVARRIGRRSPDYTATDVPGIVFLEIDGLGLPVLRRAMRDGNAPTMDSWMSSGGFGMVEWETDLSSQTGASQAGILLGSNDDIPAFRWVEKEHRRVMACSAPADCIEIERRNSTPEGALLANGGSSRGNLLSGGAAHAILTVSRLDAERGANPGYRAFFANGVNATRTLVLFTAEVIREMVASRQAIRRGVQPRGHRGGVYPLVRAAMTVAVRDLIVHSVITDMMIGRPCIYATFSSYDEVAHHSGLERADTLEALRRLDQRIGRIDRARRTAARPYQIVVLSDHGQTQGATFLQRNGYALEDLVERSIGNGSVSAIADGDEQADVVDLAMQEATGGLGRRGKKAGPRPIEERDAVVLASGNLGLVYLMARPGRLSMEQIDGLYPKLLPALREHPHIGFVLVRSDAQGPVVLGSAGHRLLDSGVVEGVDPLSAFPPGAEAHLRRTDGFKHAPDILVNSFYDAVREEGCAFEELISFHGGLGGPQTRPFILYPTSLSAPSQPLVGAQSVNRVLRGWRDELLGEPAGTGGAEAQTVPLPTG